MPKPVSKPANLPPVVVITGPTASGKSGLAMALAEAFGGVIINADSMQVYRELEILTARPGPVEMARAPHRLYGQLSGRERCSAGRWRALALEEIAAVQAAGELAILVGGTGLYIRVLEQGLADVPEIPAEVRTAAMELHRELGGAGFHAALAERDPVMAARLNPGDSQRMIRAWEVFEASGRSLAEWQAGPAKGDPGEEGPGAASGALGPAPYRFQHVVCLPPRSALYAACDARFLSMIERGALEEVQSLLALGLDPALPVMKALGVQELARYLAGEHTLDQAVEAAQQATRNYAKRQMTWLRNQLLKDHPEAEIINEQYSESFDTKIFTIIRQIILTG